MIYGLVAEWVQCGTPLGVDVGLNLHGTEWLLDCWVIRYEVLALASLVMIASSSHCQDGSRSQGQVEV
jgi:hypothetical protein